MDMSPALLTAGLGGAHEAPHVGTNGVLAMTAARGARADCRADTVPVPGGACMSGLPGGALASPVACSPAVAVVELMGQAAGTGDEAVRPVQLRFDDDAAPAPAERGDESGDEVSLGELAAMTPPGAPGADALWRHGCAACAELTPLSDLLAMMTSPGDAATALDASPPTGACV